MIVCQAGSGGINLDGWFTWYLFLGCVFIIRSLEKVRSMTLGLSRICED